MHTFSCVNTRRHHQKETTPLQTSGRVKWMGPLAACLIPFLKRSCSLYSANTSRLLVMCSVFQQVQKPVVFFFFFLQSELFGLQPPRQICKWLPSIRPNAISHNHSNWEKSSKQTNVIHNRFHYFWSCKNDSQLPIQKTEAVICPPEAVVTVSMAALQEHNTNLLSRQTVQCLSSMFHWLWSFWTMCSIIIWEGFWQLNLLYCVHF